MARISNNYWNSLQSMRQKDLKKPILFVVDMVKGFIEEGNLHDCEIGKCVDTIQQLVTSSIPSIFIADTHKEDAKEFDSYPKHCIEGSKEVEIVDILQPYAKRIFQKNSINTFFCEDFQDFLKSELSSYQDILITGCCTDLCVLQFALSLQSYCNEHNLLHRIIVVVDGVDTYHIEGIHDASSYNEFALNNMQQNGISVISFLERNETNE